jgi:hypothetical protein
MKVTMEVRGPDLPRALRVLQTAGIRAVILGPTEVGGRTPEPVLGDRVVVTTEAVHAYAALTQVRERLPGNGVALVIDQVKAGVGA